MRIAGSVSSSVYVAGVAFATPTWNPTGLSDFSSMASLFTEYRVDSYYIDITFPPVTSSTDWTTLAYVADDPTSVVTASVPTLAQMDGSMRLKSFGTTMRKKSKVALARGAVATPIPDGAGWLPVGSSYPGRTLVVSESANAASVALAFVLIPVWTISFRIRGA